MINLEYFEVPSLVGDAVMVTSWSFVLNNTQGALFYFVVIS